MLFTYPSRQGMWHVHLVSYQVNISHTPSFQLNNPYLIVLKQFFHCFIRFCPHSCEIQKTSFNFGAARCF